MTNRLYYGDNLSVLREHIADKALIDVTTSDTHEDALAAVFIQAQRNFLPKAPKS